MFSIGRLLLRLIVVPIGLGLAICAAVLVGLLGNWNRLLAMVDAYPSDGGDIDSIVEGFVLLWVVVPVATGWMLMPALIGVLIAEAFAIRSWLFHALNGAVSIWVGRVIGANTEWLLDAYAQPAVVLAAGLGAGFVYWAVAGWNAGVMKPARAAATVAGKA